MGRLRQADVVGLVALAAVLARQPHALFRPQFVWEEAAAFWATTFTMEPIAYLVESWAGYLVIPSRAAFLIARVGPNEVAPIVLLVLHAIAIGLVARFLAADRLASAIPSRLVRMGWGLSIAVLPVAEPYVSILSLQWFLAIYVAAMSLVAPRRSDYLGVVVAAMSGLAPLIALPLFIRRSASRRAVDRRGILLGVCAGIQGVVLLGSGRRPEPLSLEPFTALVIAALIATVVGAMLIPRLIPGATRLSFGYLGIATLLVGALTSGAAGRYLMATCVVIALAGVAGVVERRTVGLGIGLAILIVMVLSSPIGVPPSSDWAANAHCIGGPNPCRVPVIPEMWTVDWPGDPLLYRAPTGMGPGGVPIYGVPISGGSPGP